MHYTKFNSKAVGAILQHSDRGLDSPDIHHHSNENIDPTRTHLNYELHDRQGLTAYASYKQKIDKITAETKERTGKSIRKDAVTLCSWCLTAPKDLPPERYEDFFKTAYRWFAERYGEGNIVTSAVHMDETTPHMHTQFVPIVEKGGVRRLCAKDLETRSTLQHTHTELQKYLEQQLECPCNVLNGATINGNKTVEQLRLEALQSENEALKAEIDSLGKEVKLLQSKALEYEPSPKRTLEKRKTYEERAKTHQQAVAIKQREQALADQQREFAQLVERNNAEVEKINAKLKQRSKELEQAEQALISEKKQLELTEQRLELGVEIKARRMAEEILQKNKLVPLNDVFELEQRYEYYYPEKTTTKQKGR